MIIINIHFFMATNWLLDKKSGSSISYHLRISSAFLTNGLPSVYGLLSSLRSAKLSDELMFFVG